MCLFCKHYIPIYITTDLGWKAYNSMSVFALSNYKWYDFKSYKYVIKNELIKTKIGQEKHLNMTISEILNYKI